MRPDSSRWNVSRSINPACPRASGRSSLSLHGQRPDFDGALVGSGNPRGDGYGFVKIGRVHQEVAAKLFLGFGEWTVGGQPLAVAYTHGRCRGSGAQLAAGDVFPCLL